MYMLMELERVEQEAKQKQAEMWITHLSRMFSQTPQGEESAKMKQARERFIDMIKPKEVARALPKPRSWDQEVEKALQEAEAQKGVIINGDS